MTGPYETELAEIVNAPDWAIPQIGQLGDALGQLMKDLTHLHQNPGGEGNWADSASAAYATLYTRYSAAQVTLFEVQLALSVANIEKSAAAEAYSRLPGVSVPHNIRAAVAAATVGATIVVPELGPIPIAAGLVLGMVENLFGDQREAEAKKALDNLRNNLTGPSTVLANHSQTSNPDGGGYKDDGSKDKTPEGAAGGGSGSGTGWPSSTGHSYGGATGTGGSTGADQGYPAGDPATAGAGGYGAGNSYPPGAAGSAGGRGGAGNDSRGYGTVSPDGDLAGGTVPGTGTGGHGLNGAGNGMNGGGLQGLGIGVGSAASAAAVAAATRGGGFGGGLGGGLINANGTVAVGKGGSGGLLGSGVKAPAAAVTGEPGTAGAGASKPGGSMMGGQGGQSAPKKERRSGLGGLIAPKLDDDEEIGPRSTGAMAGSRNIPKGD